MKDEEIAKVKMKSEYDEDRDDWIVPPFQLKAKEVTLPSLGMRKAALDQMEQEKENRELAIEGGDDDEGYEDEENPRNNRQHQK